MKFGRVDFPKPLLEALRDNKLVVFAGAGVSMGEPACLPDFCTLTNIIAEHTSKTRRDTENLEEFLGRLHKDGTNVYAIANRVLSRDGLESTLLHRELLRLYQSDQSVLIVTTNFDLLFEHAAEDIFDETLPVFCAPALPLGSNFSGLIHVHGSVRQPREMVLTDSDFGRAYLSEGWARRFLLDLFTNNTVLFVGYSLSDTVMKYLVRALPPHSAEFPPRYALERAGADDRHWNQSGIVKIPYPQNCENDHSELSVAIRELANCMRRGMMGWQQLISAIAESTPSELNDEDERDIELAFEDETKTRFFTENASRPEWIDWLDKRGYLTRLFGNDPLHDSDRILSWWLVSQFLEDYSHEMFLLVGSHRTCLHPIFWQHIAQKIGLDNESILDATLLSRWTSLLLSTAPEEGEIQDGHFVFTSNHLTAIAKRCIEHEMIMEALMIFYSMTRSRGAIEENEYLPPIVTDRDLQISLEWEMIGKDDDLDDVWRICLKPHLAEIVKLLLNRVIQCLEKQYHFYNTWGRATRSSEPVSQSRSAIEPHEQDEQRGRDKNDVLIDAARDCLEWFASNQPNIAAQCCDRLVVSDVPLLRRLAVHTLTRRPDLSSDDKVRWLLEHVDVHEYAIHHEIYQSVRHAYSEASTDCRRALIERIQSSAM